MKLATIAACCIAFSGIAVRAADQAAKTSSNQQLIEMHEKMAQLHQKAADCLKADKDIKECHDAMVREYPVAKSGACPFMVESCPMCRYGMRGYGRRMKAPASPGLQAPENNTTP